MNTNTTRSTLLQVVVIFILLGVIYTPLGKSSAHTQPASRFAAQAHDQPMASASFPLYLPAVINGQSIQAPERAIAVTTGWQHTCALTESGGVRCWGRNEFGQLGDGTNTHRFRPVDVVGLTTGVKAIAAGVLHTCALLDSGAVKCWGWDFSGQLGDGNYIDRWIPVDVIDLDSPLSSIAAGGHSCGITVNSGAKCWGSNQFGEIGDGTTIWRRTPVNVSGLSSHVAQITSGYLSSCAVMEDGSGKCWGSNDYGQLGDGATDDRYLPVDVVGLTGATGIAAGTDHTCAIVDGVGVKCWGGNEAGQLGDGTAQPRSTPVDVAGISGTVRAIATGWDYTCAVLENGAVKCWGKNDKGQVGDGTTGIRITPVDVIGLTGGMTAIATGWLHTCAITESGGILCWGENDFGQLGDGTTNEYHTPAPVIGFGD